MVSECLCGEKRTMDKMDFIVTSVLADSIIPGHKARSLLSTTTGRTFWIQNVTTVSRIHPCVAMETVVTGDTRSRDTHVPWFEVQSPWKHISCCRCNLHGNTFHVAGVISMATHVMFQV